VFLYIGRRIFLNPSLVAYFDEEKIERARSYGGCWWKKFAVPVVHGVRFMERGWATPKCFCCSDDGTFAQGNISVSSQGILTPHSDAEEPKTDSFIKSLRDLQVPKCFLTSNFLVLQTVCVVGRGASSYVNKAIHVPSGRKVAVKVWKTAVISSRARIKTGCRLSTFMIGRNGNSYSKNSTCCILYVGGLRSVYVLVEFLGGVRTSYRVFWCFL